MVQQPVGAVKFSAFSDELQKIAAKKKKPGAKDFVLPAGAAIGGAGLLASPTTRGRLGGYQRVYHGTGTDVAKNIREQGMLTRFGGSGAAALHDAPMIDKELVEQARRGEVRDLAGKVLTPDDLTPTFTKHTRGCVHVAPSRTVAGLFSKFTGKGKGQAPAVVKADLPIELWEKFEKDPDMFGPDVTKKMPDPVAKHFGARSTEDVASRYIHGGRGFSRTGLMGERLRALPGYAAKHPGRFGLGVGAVGLGAAGVGWGGHQLVKKIMAMREKKK